MATRTAGLVVRFVDGAKLPLRCAKHSVAGPATIAANVRKALTPAPDVLPATVRPNARLVD